MPLVSTLLIIVFKREATIVFFMATYGPNGWASAYIHHCHPLDIYCSDAMVLSYRCLNVSWDMVPCLLSQKCGLSSNQSKRIAKKEITMVLLTFYISIRDRPNFADSFQVTRYILLDLPRRVQRQIHTQHEAITHL